MVSVFFARKMFLAATMREMNSGLFSVARTQAVRFCVPKMRGIAYPGNSSKIGSVIEVTTSISRTRGIVHREHSVNWMFSASKWNRSQKIRN